MPSDAVAQRIAAVRADYLSELYTDQQIADRNGFKSRSVVIKYTRDLRDGTRNGRHAPTPGRGPAPANLPQHPRVTYPRGPAEPEPRMPRSEANAPTMPPSLTRPRTPLQIDTPGWWLATGDQHVPFHDEKAIAATVAEAKAVGVTGVLINGDMMDMIRMSPFYREPMAGGVKSEIAAGRQFLRYLRWHFPDARMVYREGNHEMRWRRYIVQKAEELADVDELTLPAQLHLGELNVEWVQDKRLVRLGHLNTLHGHELSKGGGVNPARYAFLKATDTVLVSHWHQVSSHPQRTLSGKQIMTWSIGCLCDLSPDYMPYGQNQHGFALVKVEADGSFMVRNHRIRDGRVE